ncbi:MAG: 4-hydroxy-tetrahydrodipicolinate synthase, partial [Actinomycetota bacterium]
MSECEDVPKPCQVADRLETAQFRVQDLEFKQGESMDLSGVHVPLVTPFDSNGVVDTKSIAHIAEVMIANGISGIVAAGTTGEAYAL